MKDLKNDITSKEASENKKEFLFTIAFIAAILGLLGAVNTLLKYILQV